MWASALALSRPVSGDAPISIRRLAPVLIPGVAIGLAAPLAFGAIHAWLIVPIWSQLPGGIPIAVLAGLLMAWAFDRVSRVRGPLTPVHGLLFGVYMFGTLLPTTAVDAVMRLNGMRLGDTTPGMVAGVALFALSGLVAGRVFSRQRSTALVFAMAALALMAVAGGPLPIVRSARGAWLSCGIGGITAVAGAGIAAVRSAVAHRL